MVYPIFLYKITYAVVFLTIIVVYLVHNTLSQNDFSASPNKYSKRYLIDTSHCKIPKTDVINERLRPLMTFNFKDLKKKPYCHYDGDKYKPPLIASDQNTLYVIAESIKSYRKNPNEKIQCSYSPFWKNAPDDKNHVKYGNKVYFNNSITMPPEVEFVWVECLSQGTRVYHEYHAFVPKKPTTKKPPPATKRQVNVLVYGIDSVSRINFHRQMTSTSKLIKNLNFIEYLGYNKVADNTFPNMIPFLTGHTPHELRTICWHNDSVHFDDCPFIWKKYKQHTTALIEEQSWLSLFRYVSKVGFIRTPTDHYYYTFDREAVTWTSRSIFGLSRACFGARLSQEVFLQYNTKLVQSLKDTPLFIFSWSSTLSHDYLNLIRLLDPMYLTFLNFLKNSGMLESSVIFFMSDHGLRFGKILETKEGYMEERLPLFTASFPTWFPKEYPLAYRNFLANAKRLATPFDAHETLNDLYDLDNIRDDVINRRSTELSKRSPLPRGISLFLPIPRTRTCYQAGIPFGYCACITSEGKSAVDANESKRISNFLLSKINEILRSHPKCAQLRLITAKRMEYVKVDKQHFMMTSIQTTPGNGIFQALIKTTDSNKDRMSINGDITRLNSYGSQSACMNNNKLKLYCYCK